MALHTGLFKVKAYLGGAVGTALLIHSDAIKRRTAGVENAACEQPVGSKLNQLPRRAVFTPDRQSAVAASYYKHSEMIHILCTH
jgi:hypothetical protein